MPACAAHTIVVRRRMHNIRAEPSGCKGFTDTAKSIHNVNRAFGEALMTMTLIWAGVAVWIGLNVAFVLLRTRVTSSSRTAPARAIDTRLRRIWS
jgi:hypothetical protein